MKWHLSGPNVSVSNCGRYCVERLHLDKERTYTAWALPPHAAPAKQLASNLHCAREAQETCLFHSIRDQSQTSDLNQDGELP